MNPSRRRSGRAGRRFGLRRGIGGHAFRSPSGQFMKTRRHRRNPSVKRKKHLSPAVRAKISRAVKRSMHSRKSGGSTKAVRRMARRGKHLSPAVRRKISLAVKRSQRRGGSRRSTSTAVSHRPTYSRAKWVMYGNKSGGMSSLTQFAKSFISKENLAVAGGAIGGTILTNTIVAKAGSSLPLMTDSNGAPTKYGAAIYQAVIPVGIAFAIRRRYPNLARGLLLGGLINTIATLWQNYGPAGSSLSIAPIQASYAGFGLSGDNLSSRGTGYLAYPQNFKRYANPGVKSGPIGSPIRSFGAAPKGGAFDLSAW